jgi:undecaprenyl-diphosphatase
LSIWEAFWLALLHGATEILPVPSLGRGIVLTSLLGRHVNQEAPTFLPFFVVLYLGTVARFSYLLTPPVILVAGALEVTIAWRPA